MKDIPREPTYDEVHNHTDVGDGWIACWYPQMGGYCGKAVIRWDSGCFEAYVWHDGDFPFSTGEELWPPTYDDYGNAVTRYKEPAFLHHCSADQFIAFGEFAESLRPE